MTVKFPEQVAAIEDVCSRLGISPDDLADRAGIKRETMRKIRKGYQKASDRLLQSINNVAQMAALFKGKAATALKEEAAPSLNWVPVISWTNAGLGGDYEDLEHQISERVQTDCRDPNAYSLIVEGDSMEPVLQRGDRLIVTPNIEPRNGNIVVARLRKDERAIVKLFHQTGERGEIVRLTSYNPAYPPLEFKRSRFRVIQPVHSVSRKLL